MYFLISLLILCAGAAAVVTLRRRSAALAALTRSYGDAVHPATLRALLSAGPDSELVRDGRWLKEHEREISERFPGQWVAVVGGEVAAVAARAEDALKASRAARPDRAPFLRRMP